MTRNIALEAADGVTFFAAYKIIANCLGVIEQPGAFGAWAFVAGAIAVATILFVDYYLWARTQ